MKCKTITKMAKNISIPNWIQTFSCHSKTKNIPFINRTYCFANYKTNEVENLEKYIFIISYNTYNFIFNIFESIYKIQKYFVINYNIIRIFLK